VSALSRAAGYAGFVLLGVVAGACGVVMARATVDVLGVPLPYGLVLALVVAGLLFGQGRRFLGRRGALTCVLGWIIPVGIALWPRPEGDFLVAGDWYGLGFMLVGVILIAWQLLRGDPEPRR
jgi:hypothetical protein